MRGILLVGAIWLRRLRSRWLRIRVKFKSLRTNSVPPLTEVTQKPVLRGFMPTMQSSCRLVRK